MSQVVITSEKGLSEPEKQHIAQLWSCREMPPEDLTPYIIGYKR